MRPRRAEFLDLERQIDELFEELIYRRWSITRPPRWRPPLDLHETPDAYIVEIDVPALDPEEVHILASERNLIITGQRRLTSFEGTVFARLERSIGEFKRSVELPQPIDPEKIAAEYQYGSYRIVLPKKRSSEKKDAELSPAEGRQGFLQVIVHSRV